MSWIWDVFGNNDDPKAPDWYKPFGIGWNWFRNGMWYVRNPFHNLFFYKWGIVKEVREGEAKLFEQAGKEWIEVEDEKDGEPWSRTWAEFGGWHNTKWETLNKTYKCWSWTKRNLEKRRDAVRWYFGWRPTSGAFGAKLQFFRKMKSWE